MRSHTPGPWSYEAEHLGQFTVTASERHYIAGVGAPWDELAEVQEANACLIATAPDLLELAKTYASECGECNGTGLVTVTTWPGGIEVDNDDQPCAACEDIRAVIAKATGATA